MAGGRRKDDPDEFYRHAAEARRMADAPGTTPAERADFPLVKG
jgi:hypothetical protein